MIEDFNGECCTDFVWGKFVVSFVLVERYFVQVMYREK